MTKPSLHEIAAMPFPASLNAMRENYNPQWGKDCGDGEIKEFTIEVSYDVRGSQSITVEAFTSSEAEDVAAAQVCKRVADDLGVSDHDVDCTNTRVLETKQ